jgi:ABC-type cobalamin/Fe3+-siderophores transport system ATPase subunit
MHHFRLYGLNIDSEVELPAPTRQNSAPSDIHISFAPDMPTRLEKSLQVMIYQIDVDHNVLMEAEFGWLLIRQGKEMFLKLRSPESLKLATQYILGSAMSVILYQRQTLVLHASAVSKNGEATLIVGKSGFGKSTTAALLQTKGYRLLSDDLSVIHFKNRQAWVESATPVQKIGLDVLKEMDVTPLDSQLTAADGRLKYFRSAKAFSHEPTIVKHIYCLRKAAIHTARIKDESTLFKFHHLYRNSFRFKLIAPLAFSQKHLFLCQALYKSTDVFFLERPKSHLDLAGVLEAIERNSEK